MKRMLIGMLLAATICSPAAAGVVYEIEVTDHEQSPPKMESIEAAVEGRNLKMGIAAGSTQERGDMIFRGDRREVVVVDHDEKSYVVMDKEAIGAIAGQVGSAMAQVEEALKNVPEDKRAMVEEMMKKRMPQEPPSRPTTELRKTGERADKNGYPCVKYEIVRNGVKIRELWVTDWSNVEGGKDVVDTWHDMADFFREMMDALPDFGQGGPAQDPAFEHMKELEGFPVVTREFGDGDKLETESTLRSARRRTLDPADFEPPSGYKRRSMGPR